MENTKINTSNKPLPLWIDTHCHLEMIKNPVDETIRLSEGLQTPVMVTIGTTHESNIYINRITREYAQVFGTLGFHPHGAGKFEPENLEFIREALKTNPKIIGIGECGYDFHYHYSTPEDQMRVFEIFLKFALEIDYPIVIHSREADEATMEIMAPYLKQGLRAVLHSFTSTEALADFGMSYDCYFSFNGISTYKKSEDIRTIFSKIPLNRILLETDSPYLSPGPYRGKPNIPGYVSWTGQYLADLRQLDPIEFSAIVNENARKFYNNFEHGVLSS